MNWKDELMEEMGYTICTICFPEYVHCKNDCEHCEEYIDFKQYYEGNKKVRKEAGRVNEEEEKINNTIALKVMSIEELKRVKEKVEKTQGDNVRFKVETKHWYGYSEPFLAKDKDVLNISKYTMQLILEEAINKEKERINKLTDKIIELRRASNDR